MICTIWLCFFSLFLYNMIQLSEKQRIHICILLDEEVYTQLELVQKFNVSKSTIFWLYEKYKKTQTTKDLPKPGWPQNLTIHEERHSVHYIINEKCSTITQVQKKL